MIVLTTAPEIPDDDQAWLKRNRAVVLFDPYGVQIVVTDSSSMLAAEVITDGQITDEEMTGDLARYYGSPSYSEYATSLREAVRLLRERIG